jgi:phosphatidylglycerophosphate synthase
VGRGDHWVGEGEAGSGQGAGVGGDLVGMAGGRDGRAAVDWTGWIGVGLGVAGVAILAWTALTRTPVSPGRPDPPRSPTVSGPDASPPPVAGPEGSVAREGGEGWGFEAYEAGWRAVHSLGEGVRPGGRLAAGYLRLPHAAGVPLARAGVDPDLVTLGALWVALVAGWSATLGPGWAAAAGVLTLLAGVADSVDGAVAVMQGRATSFGFVWDSTADRLADLAMIAGPVVLVVNGADPGWGAAALAAGGAAAGLLLLLEYVRARAQAGQVAAAWSLATPGERPTRVIVLGLAGLAVGAAQLAGGGPAAAALELGYPLALAALAVVEAAGCVQLLLAVRHAETRLR